MSRPWRYEIQVEGRLDERWAGWFDDLEVSFQNAPQTTTLRGPVVDQAALLGLLQRLYTLGLPLLLVRREGDPERPVGRTA